MKYDLMKKLDIILEKHKKNLYDEFMKNKYVIEEEKIYIIKNYLNEIKNDPKKYFNLIKEIYNILNLNVSEDEKAKIEAGIIICNFGFDLSSSQIDFVNEQVAFIENKINEYDLRGKEEYDDGMRHIKGLQYKVNHNKITSSKDIENLRDYLLESNLTFEELVDGLEDDILKKINENIALSGDELEEEPEQVIEDSNSIDKNELFELFNKYGYSDIKFLKTNDLNWILSYGNYENIESILEIFSGYIKNNFDSDIKLPLDFGSKSRQISLIMTITNSSNVLDMLNILSNESDTLYEFLERFEKMLRVPGVFVRGKKIFKEKGNSGGSDGGKQEVTPALHILENNIELFKNWFSKLPLDLREQAMNLLWDKHPSILLNSTGMIRKNITRCDNYEIPIETMAKALTGILKPFGDIYVTFDHLFELGDKFEKYLFNYPSIVCRGKDFVNKLIALAKNGINVFSNEYSDNSQLKNLDKIYIEQEKISDSIKPINKKFINEDEEKIIEEIIENFKINKDYKYTIALKSEVISVLENTCKVSNYAYEIGGIRISRYRLLMYFDALIREEYDIDENIFKYVLYKNMLINEKEFEIIEKELENLFPNFGVNTLKLEN